jgi:hypothetical protein
LPRILRRSARHVNALCSPSLAIGKAVSDLVRRGLHAPLETRIVNGFHVVKLPPGSPPVSTEDVEKLLDQ